jgi:hypothetical protein
LRWTFSLISFCFFSNRSAGISFLFA